MWYIRRLPHGECECVWPCSYSQPQPWRVKSIEIGFWTTIFENKCQRQNIIKVSKQLFTFLMVFRPQVPHFLTWKLISTSLVTGVQLRSQIFKIVLHRASLLYRRSFTLYLLYGSVLTVLQIMDLHWVLLISSGYPQTSREPHMPHGKSYHQVGWVNPLREETPVLLRQWSLMPPAHCLRSRRIHHRTDGHMINIHWMKSQGSDLSQWSFTFKSLLDSN